ncbi:hypothetical protein THAOC_05683, partial [Thalassiosira oceanica]
MRCSTSVVLAFGSVHFAASFSPVAPAVLRPVHANKESSSAKGVVALFTAASDGDDAETIQRRSFLAKLAASLVGAPLALGRPQSADASFFGNNMVEGVMKRGDESIMSPKAHGTTDAAVQERLRFGVDRKLADKISSYTRDFAERAGYYLSTSFEDDVTKSVARGDPLEFYDSVSGKPLFKAPVGRDLDEFLAEARGHGWPSFRDDEVNWENVRVLRNGETVSVGGTHLGHNIPDSIGNRYCI